jgi:hypothetical protein
MRRIVVWVDSKDDSVDHVKKGLKKYFGQNELTFSIVDTTELVIAKSGSK